eukprot:scaffold310_cov335-Pavlova_lutheri.AAC.18
MGRAWFRGKIPGFEREIRSGSNRRSSDQIDPFEPERTGVRSSPPSSPSEGGGAIHPRPLLEPDIDTSLSKIPMKSPSCIDIVWA